MAIILAEMYNGFVESVNGKNGIAVLIPEDIGAYGASNINEAVVPISLQPNTAYTLLISDRGTFIKFTNASAIACTIPAEATVNFPIGTVISFMQVGIGQLTLVPDSGVTLLTSTGLNTSSQYAVVTALKTDADEWTISGGLVA